MFTNKQLTEEFSRCADLAKRAGRLMDCRGLSLSERAQLESLVNDDLASLDNIESGITQLEESLDNRGIK